MPSNRLLSAVVDMMVVISLSEVLLVVSLMVCAYVRSVDMYLRPSLLLALG